MFYPSIPINRPMFPVLRAGADREETLLYSKGKPFFYILTDNGVAAQFLEAVAADTEEAAAFISKHSAGIIDLEALRDMLGGANSFCSSWVQASYSGEPKNCMTRSVMLVDQERNINRLLHLHMIREPDRYGQWKIYGVDQE